MGGDMKGAFVLDGPYTKTSAVEKLRSEARAGITSRLPGWLFLTIFSPLPTGFIRCSASDDLGWMKVCDVLFALVILMSIANFSVILISFIVQGSYVPLACVWLVLACCCGCIFAEVGERKRRTNSPEGLDHCSGAAGEETVTVVAEDPIPKAVVATSQA